MLAHTLITHALIIISLLAQYSSKADIETQQYAADLDGDGTTETITLEYMPDGGDYTLTIDTASIEGYLEPWLMGMELVDIDPDDRQMEIAVQTAGPSDDYETIYYSFRNARIVEVGHVFGYANPEGNGDVHATVWMGFWMRTDSYRLNPSSHVLEMVPQELYAVLSFDSDVPGIECTVLDSFPIQAYRDGEMLENLADGSTITIIACDLSEPLFYTGDTWHDSFSDWYLIVSETGMTGWATLGSFSDKVEGLNWAD